jgi:hypothetical protein
MLRSLLLGLGLLGLAGVVWAAAAPPPDARARAKAPAKSAKKVSPKKITPKDVITITITPRADGSCWDYSDPGPIPAGSTVVWQNNSSVGHTATADDGSWDTGVIPAGQQSSPQSVPPGTHTYHCNIHGCMSGTLVVGNGGQARPAAKARPGAKVRPR